MDILGESAEYLWHKEVSVASYDCLILPGGFSYGDYLRPGAIAGFSPIMSAVTEFANAGGPILGSCNGFQILCEVGLLPGALMRNNHLQFRCEPANLVVENDTNCFTRSISQGQVLSIPISHGDGNYYVDDETLGTLEANGQVVFRYCKPNGEVDLSVNPNGAKGNIAGVTNIQGNVLGMMPHPERAVEEQLGGTDGLLIFKAIETLI